MLKAPSVQLKSNDKLHAEVQAISERMKRMVSDLGKQRRLPKKAGPEDVLTSPESTAEPSYVPRC